MSRHKPKGGTLHHLSICGVSPYVRAWCATDLDSRVGVIRKMAAAGKRAHEIAEAIGLSDPQRSGAARITKYIRKNRLVWNRDRSKNYPYKTELIDGAHFRAKEKGAQ